MHTLCESMLQEERKQNQQAATDSARDIMSATAYDSKVPVGSMSNRRASLDNKSRRKSVELSGMSGMSIARRPTGELEAGTPDEILQVRATTLTLTCFTMRACDGGHRAAVNQMRSVNAH